MVKDITFDFFKNCLIKLWLAHYILIWLHLYNEGEQKSYNFAGNKLRIASLVRSNSQLLPGFPCLYAYNESNQKSYTTKKATQL